MLDGSPSGCINHAGVDAAFRCKQCQKPVCRACVVQSGWGNFCSEACQTKFETFAQRAAALDAKQRGGWGLKLRRTGIKLALYLGVPLAVVYVAITYRVPVLSEMVWHIRSLIGF